MEAQEYTIKDNILHQDNESTILLQEWKEKCWEAVGALNVRYWVDNRSVLEKIHYRR